MEIDFERYDYFRQTYHLGYFGLGSGTALFIQLDLEFLAREGWEVLKSDYDWNNQILFYWFYRSNQIAFKSHHKPF